MTTTATLPTTATDSTPTTRQFDDSQRTPCEIWTRVMGYHRPVASFNRGKQSEFAERRCFEEPVSCQ
jgi:hypothetical protein